MTPQPETIAKSIMDQLARYTRRDAALSTSISLQRLRRQAASLKDVNPIQYYTVLGAIACIEADVSNMHKHHRNAIALSAGGNDEFYNYMASLDISCLWEEGYSIAVDAFQKDSNDYNKLLWVISKSERTFRFNALHHYLQLLKKFRPDETHEKEEYVKMVVAYMSHHSLTDEDMATYFFKVSDILHRNGAVVSKVKQNLLDQVICVDLTFDAAKLDLEMAADNIKKQTQGLKLDGFVRLYFNGKVVAGESAAELLKNRDDIAARIASDWGDDPSAEVSLQIADYILQTDQHDLQHLTYGSFRKVIGDKHPDPFLLQAIQYLTGDRLHLLQPAFEFIDDDDEIYPLTLAELSSAKAKKIFVHPATGQVIDDFERRIFIYFQRGPVGDRLGR